MNDRPDIRLLGPVRWYLDGRPLPAGGPLTRTMLAVLTVNRRNTMSPRRLARTIWDGDPPPTYRSNLHNRIAEARAALTAAGASGMDAGPRVADLEQRILRGEPIPLEPRIRLRPFAGTEDSTLLETLGHYVLYIDDGRRFEVRRPMTIGRGADNDIRLADAKTSRHHARLAPDGDEMRIEDLDSANGVYVNDTRIRGAVRLTAGDRLRIGSMTLNQAQCVAALQSFLRFNYGNGDLTVDGKFGARTKSALINFQRSAGLTADGVAGARTWQAIANDCGWRGDCDYKYPGALPD